MIWISAAGKLPLLICSVYLPYNLCSSTADRIFLSWHALTVPNFRVLVGGCTCSSPAEQHCWIAVVGSASDNPTRWITAHFQSRNPAQFFQIGWAFSMKTKSLHCCTLTSTGLFSYWQMYWPTFCAICHCPVFRCIWDEDKCCPWSRDLPSFLLRVAFGINWYQEQSLSLNVEKINTLQWSWQPCSLV